MPFFPRAILLAAIIVGCHFADSLSLLAQQPPEIPIGFDAYRQWDKWPYQRLGVRAYMRSTYDRRGNNESADASHFLYQLRDDFNVTLDIEGQGILYFARYNHWHGSPWHYEVDGRDHIVKETTTKDPTKKLKHSVFLPEKQFPSPLTFTYATTKGADLMWVPIGFKDRFRMAYSRTFYGTGYYIYHHYMRGAKLSQPIRSWNEHSIPPKDVIKLLENAGTDIAPQADTQQGLALGINSQSKTITLPANSTKELVQLEGSGMVRAIKISVPKDRAVDFDDVRIRITWDSRQQPSVDAPAPLFFGTGTFYNPSQKEFVVKALPVNVRYTDDRMLLGCYFPMPYFQSAKIELINNSSQPFTDIQCEIRTQPFDDPPNHVGYFHATYVDHPDPEMGQDLVFLDTQKVEGGGPWSGNFVGTSFIFSDRGRLWTLEGDPRFFFDDSQSPQAYGTGTEEWGGGGDYWGGDVMTLPLAGHPMGTAGHPVGGRQLATSTKKGLIESAYRYLLADLMPFGRRAVIRLEHGGINNFPEHYQSVTYWYGAPFATLELTDSIDIGDEKSEAAHQYESPNASEPYQLTSRFEWGPDKIPLEGKIALAEPKDYADFEFEADAGKRYNIWLRGRSSGGIDTDATWFQFDQDIGIVRSFYATGNKGYGNWRDKAEPGVWSWSSSLPSQKPKTVRFRKSGKHRLRVQRRQGGHTIDRIWLSATQAETPDPDFIPQPSSDETCDEIVLTGNEVTQVAGVVKIVDSDDQKRISIGGQGGRDWLEAFPQQTHTGRTTTTHSEFRIALKKNNLGVLLRRTLDYQFPNQRAVVYVADADTKEPNWQKAGVWYLAGSNTCYYSHPGRRGGELGKSNPRVQTSNRRLRDDEYMLPRDLTQGREAIRVRLEFTPTNIPLLPNRELAQQAWSEIAYQAYCYVLPEWKPAEKKNKSQPK